MEGRKPLVCIPVVATTGLELIQDIIKIQDLDFQIIELRIDFYEHIHDISKVNDLLNAIEAVNHKDILFTYRSKTEGGNILLEDTYLKELQAMVSQHPAITYQDVEYHCACRDELIEIMHSNNKQVILSNHNFEETPTLQEMNEFLEKMAKTKADILKVAYMPKNKQDVIHVIEATLEAKQYNKPIISMSMGALGTISRLVGEFSGNYLTFAMHTQASAPGQMNIDEVNQVLETIHQAMKTK